MKVLQINAVYGHGSTGVIIRDIEQLCELSDIECYVASPDPKVREAKRGFIIGNVFDHKLHAVLSRINGKQAYFSRLATKRLLAYMDDIKPDIVHLHNLHSNYIHLNMLLQYLAKNDIRTIVTLHDCWFYTGGCFHYTAAGCMRWLESCGNCPKKKQDTPAYLWDCSANILADRKKYLLAIPRLTVTGVSEWISNEAKRTFLANTSVVTIRNGVDLDVFKPTPSDFRSHLDLQDKYIILGPASKWLLPINKQVLVDFVSMMKEDEILLLFGVWTDLQKKYIKSLHLGDKVVTYGYTKSRKELTQLYTMADVFVNCSREDSLSLINIEAQACGTPVVTFDQTGPKETVDDCYSFSVATGDVIMLYKKVSLVKHGATNKTQIRKFVSITYEIRNNYSQYISLYKKFCQ